MTNRARRTGYRRIVAAAVGAEIVWPLDNPEYGGVFFSCRDPEGHIWNIGSCDPWTAH